jgi:hypothetical protein
MGKKEIKGDQGRRAQLHRFTPPPLAPCLYYNFDIEKSINNLNIMNDM